MRQTLLLHKGQSVALADARSAVLSVLGGRIWLTQEFDRRDVVLEAGDSWAVDRQGLTIAQAQAASTVWITCRACLVRRMKKVARRRWPQRLIAWLARSARRGACPRYPYY